MTDEGIRKMINKADEANWDLIECWIEVSRDVFDNHLFGIKKYAKGTILLYDRPVIIRDLHAKGTMFIARPNGERIAYEA